MPEQKIVEIKFSYVIDEANKTIETEINKYHEEGYYVKQICTLTTTSERLFILLEKYESNNGI